VEGASPPEDPLPEWKARCRCPFEYPADRCKAPHFRTTSRGASAAPRGLDSKIFCSKPTVVAVFEDVSTSMDIGRRTSATLINRVKDLDDDDGWREFYDPRNGSSMTFQSEFQPVSARAIQREFCAKKSHPESEADPNCSAVGF